MTTVTSIEILQIKNNANCCFPILFHTCVVSYQHYTRSNSQWEYVNLAVFEHSFFSSVRSTKLMTTQYENVYNSFDIGSNRCSLCYENSVPIIKQKTTRQRYLCFVLSLGVEHNSWKANNINRKTFVCFKLNVRFLKN